MNPQIISPAWTPSSMRCRSVSNGRSCGLGVHPPEVPHVDRSGVKWNESCSGMAMLRGKPISCSKAKNHAGLHHNAKLDVGWDEKQGPRWTVKGTKGLDGYLWTVRSPRGDVECVKTSLAAAWAYLGSPEAMLIDALGAAAWAPA